MTIASRTSTANIRHRDKMAEVLDLRRKGYLLREIADHLGIKDLGSVTKLIQKALREITREPAEEVLQMELDRLDQMFVAAFTRASNKILPFDPDAVATCVRIMERRAKLLGLDKPAKVANTDPSGENEAQAVQIYVPDNGRSENMPV